MSNSYRHKVTITFASPNTQPPVYVAGAFTDPPWEPSEMEHEPSVATDSHLKVSREYRFFKEFEIAEGQWQYKFRLGLGDWWVCEQNAETVTDQAGNCNNLLTVSPDKPKRACVEKHIHARPFSNSQASSHESAWEVVEADPVPLNTPATPAEGHQNHCHINGHFNPHCSREAPFEGRHSAPADATSEIVNPDRASQHRDNPLLAHSKAGLEYLRTLSGHSQVTGYVIPEISIESEHYGDRKMSVTDIEKVKLLMSMPSPVGSARSTMAVYDGDILELEHDYSGRRLSPGLPETNVHSHAPLLPHECLTCDDIGSEAGAKSPACNNASKKDLDLSATDSARGPPTPDDFDSPHLELFPSGAENILQRMATLKKELPPDETVSFDDEEALYGSPSWLTRDAPSFSHELPPIGSPADIQRKQSVSDFPEIARHDGSSDTRSRSSSRRTSPFLPPTAISLDGPLRIDSFHRSFADINSLDDPQQPLLQGDKPAHPEVGYAASHPALDASEGARLRSARTVDIVSSTEDSFSASDEEKGAPKSLWSYVLEWFSSLWARLWRQARTD